MSTTSESKVAGHKTTSDDCYQISIGTGQGPTTGSSGYDIFHVFARVKGPSKMSGLIPQVHKAVRNRVFLGNSFRMPDMEFIDSIEAGVDPQVILLLASHMGTSNRSLQVYLDLHSTTIERKKSKAINLDLHQSERVAGLKRLIDQVRDMVEDSGDTTDFDAAEWLGRWIVKPLPALGGKKPADYLSTVSGQKMLSNLLSQMQSGAYA